MREDHGHRDRWPTGDLSERQTTVAELGSHRAHALLRAQSVNDPVIINGREYVVTSYSVDHTADPSSHGLVTFELTRLRRVTVAHDGNEVADVDLLPTPTHD